MTHYDCRCRRHHRPPVTTVLPSQRLFEVDPEPDQPSTAQLQAQEKRRARV